jgi:hypothetical protein
LVLQAAISDCVSFDPFSFQQDGLGASEVDFSNLADRDAGLKVESPIGIPDSFDLVLDHAPVRCCRVTWRKATQIGVEFA